MITAYNIGLLAGALTSALIFSRGLFWLARNSLRGWARAAFANAVSFLIIIAITSLVRGHLAWHTVLLHLAAQAAWLCIDLMVEKRDV